ncbi:hypothetical protein ADU59_20475 [Pararhizobium polonicum]|uniref:Dihydrodipicolinate reductase n=1 Tax=Pararhizobium polonicum TaxID=1612624 RepID=A0A1C7NX82_9HYPH|nr:DUF1674 domain-containing protein [Pararhizobium polonicum]OBZ93620.1 hypothetical protein ADU59_20475 [Pararhizobium polonicum]
MMGIFGAFFNIFAEIRMQNDNDNAAVEPRKPLSPAARRALAEAEERRKAQQPLNLPEELGGRGGAEPVRFGDWEINGRAIDF